MHDLIRAYSGRLAADEDEEHDTSAAMDALYVAEKHRRSSAIPSALHAPRLENPTAARAWMDTERSNVVAIGAYAARHGWDSYAIRLATTVFRYLETRGHYADAGILQDLALRCARDMGDELGEARLLTNLSVVHWRQGQADTAAQFAHQALTLFRHFGDEVGKLMLWRNSGL
jgi:hypothetical protein